MSEEKLCAVKNDEGKYWDFSDNDIFWSLAATRCPTTSRRNLATSTANEHGGHVVALVEEPEKVVVSPEEAKLLKNCLWTNLQDSFLNNINLLFRGRRPEDVTRLKSALTNGYTVEKEKKYLLPMDGTLEENDGYNNYQIYAYCYKGRWLTDECETDPAYKHFTVTQKELDTAPAWVKAITPVEVTDDGE